MGLIIRQDNTLGDFHRVALLPQRLEIIVEPWTQDRIFVFTFEEMGTLALRMTQQAIVQIRNTLMQIERRSLN